MAWLDAHERRPGVAAEGRMLEALAQFVEALPAIPKPVIAAVEGAAEDAGFSLTLACDLIVAAEDARFVLGLARLGPLGLEVGKGLLAQHVELYDALLRLNYRCLRLMYDACASSIALMLPEEGVNESDMRK